MVFFPTDLLCAMRIKECRQKAKNGITSNINITKKKSNLDSSNFKGMCRMMGSDFKNISEMLIFRMHIKEEAEDS